MASAGEKARPIVYNAVGNHPVVAELAGNNRYIAVTEDAVYVCSTGISSGTCGGQRLKHYPVDSITSVDIRSAFMTVELEIVLSGGHESERTNAGFMDRTRNENITMFSKGQLQQVQHLARVILDLQQWRRRQMRQLQVINQPPPSIPELIKQLAELKAAGAISEEEFERKKSELLNRM